MASLILQVILHGFLPLGSASTRHAVGRNRYLLRGWANVLVAEWTPKILLDLEMTWYFWYINRREEFKLILWAGVYG